MAKCTSVCVAFSCLLFIEVFHSVASFSSSTLPESAKALQRRSAVVLRKKKGDTVIVVPPRAANAYYPARYYPVSPIQFYPIRMPMVYRPMVRQRRRYRPPPSPAHHHSHHHPPVVEVIDEVTPFYNFIRRHLIPSYIKDLSRIAEMSKKTVYHYHPEHDEEQSDASSEKRQKSAKSRLPKEPLIYADDPYDSFYYQPQTKIKSKQPILKLRPEEYNAAILEAFSPAWAESSAWLQNPKLNESSVFAPSEDAGQYSSSSREVPSEEDESAGDETQLTYQWLQPSRPTTQNRPKPVTLATTTKPTVAPSLFFRAVDDYSNPIFQHLPLMTKDIRNHQQTVGLPGQNDSSLLFLPVSPKHTGQTFSRNQMADLSGHYDVRSMSYPEILTTMTTTTTTTSSTTTTKRPIIGHIPAKVATPVSVLQKANQTDNKWKAIPTNKRKDLVAFSTFNRPRTVVQPSKPKSIKMPVASRFNRVRSYLPVKTRLENRPIGSSTVSSNTVISSPSMAVTVGTMMDFNQNSQLSKESSSDFFPGIVIDESVGLTTDPDIFEMNALPSKTIKNEHVNKVFAKFPLHSAPKNASTRKWKPIQTLTTPQPYIEKLSSLKNQNKTFQFNLPNVANFVRKLAFQEKHSATDTQPETEEDIKKLHRVFDELGRVSAQKSKKTVEKAVLNKQSKGQNTKPKFLVKENIDSKAGKKPLELPAKFCSGRETGYYADVSSNCKVNMQKHSKIKQIIIY